MKRVANEYVYESTMNLFLIIGKKGKRTAVQFTEMLSSFRSHPGGKSKSSSYFVSELQGVVFKITCGRKWNDTYFLSGDVR